MIGQAVFYGIALICNSILVSGTIFSEPRDNDLEYRIVKRGSQDPQESPDSKERRSQMGSSFIRFGRSRFEGNLENSDYASGNELDSILGPGSSSTATASRIARGRSDVIIRFGRSDPKNSSPSKFLRYGSKPLQVNDLDQLALVCSDAEGDNLGLYLPNFRRLCNSLGFSVDQSFDNRRNSNNNNVIEFLEDTSQGQSVKHQ